MKAFFIDSFNVENFILDTTVKDDYIIRFTELIYDEHKKEALIRTIVVEEGFKQDFFIRVKYMLENKKWKVALAIPAQIYPTEVIIKALMLVSQKN